MLKPQPLTENEVRAIKRALIKGAHPTAIAILYGINAESVRRIKRGETHNRIRVEGEEALRPQIGFIQRETPEIAGSMTKAEADELERELLEHQARMLEKGGTRAAIDESVEEEAKRMLGLD